MTVLAFLLAPSSVPAARPRIVPPPPPTVVPVARLSLGDGVVEQVDREGSWKRVGDGFRVKTGDRLRTGRASIARVEFPWMSIVMSPSSVISIPLETVLSTVLEEGRVEHHAEGGDIIKLRTAEAQIRGGGRLVVRRERNRTHVSVVAGRFRVQAGGDTVALGAGEGTVVEKGQLPSAVKLSDAPVGLSPGADPVYVPRGRPVDLSWKPAATPYHLQVLGVGSDDVLIDRDVEAAQARVEIPWLGTFRWRVASRDESGLEGMPSAEGYVCVVDK